MLSITGIGEAMGELRLAPEGRYSLHFSGDVFNTLAYARALGGTDWDATFVSAVGDDSISKRFLARCAELDIKPAVAASPGKPLGLYLIETDEQGERRFFYWRYASPARQLMTLMPRIEKFDPDCPGILFLSGITLAILDDPQREALADLVANHRRSGAPFAFDPNYRATLWDDVAAARTWISRFYTLSDLAFPGLEDEFDLNGLDTPEAILARTDLANAAEVLVKAGRNGVVGRVGSHHFASPFIAPPATIDTTAAGDSFNAAWIVARAVGLEPQRSAEFATRTAAAVAGHPGAIIPFEALPTLSDYLDKSQ